MTDQTAYDLAYISELIRQDPGERKFSGAAPWSDLPQAAEALQPCRRILILTGFYIPEAGTAETDGLTGALILARALAALGKTVCLVCDQPAAPYLRTGMELLPSPILLRILPSGQGEAERTLAALQEDLQPDCILSIERPGQARDGRCYSMNGTPLPGIIPRLDGFFLANRNRSCATIAIGDGGNELGTGALSQALLPETGELFQTISCTTPADWTIPAGVSNWGGYGLAAALSLLSGTPLLPDPGTEMKLLKALAAKGAVDGTTLRHEATVDGLPQEHYLEPIRELHRLVSERLGC